MKFAEQVASYSSMLRRKSRFFSSLMLVSGISLAAAAPFLSYEVSQIECAEKGSVVTQGNTDEVQTLKNELEGKDETIFELEGKIDDINKEISNLASNPDCDNLLRVIEDERDRLATELTEVTAGSTTKDETITELEREVEVKNEEISDLASNPDCENLVRVIEKDRDRLAAELKEVTAEAGTKDNSINRLQESLKKCELRLRQISNTEPDCGEYTEEIVRLKRTILTKDETIEELIAAQQEPVSCPTISLAGTFRNNESFIFGLNNFRVSVNLEDVGPRYGLIHNRVNVTSKIKSVNKGGVYTFTDKDSNSYQITFGNVSKGILPYALISL